VRGALAVAAAALLWGLWPLWIRGGAGGAQVAAVAMLVAGAAGLPLALWQARGRRRRPRDAALVSLLGLFAAGNVWLYFRALDEGAIAPAVLSHYLAPVLVALAAPRLLGEPRSPRTPLALALALGGTAVLLLGAPDAGADRDATLFALAFGGGSAVFYAALVLLSKHLTPRFGDAELLSYHVLVGGVLLTALQGGALGSSEQLLRPALGGLLSTLVAGLAYYHGLRRIPAERAAILAYLEPPAAITVGWLAFGDRPGLAAAAGGALILAAGILVVLAPGRGDAHRTDV
jgi:drug/metabolite transporter (DMT)-like permease